MFEGYKVALVDDDPALRGSLAQTLELAGFEVMVMDSAEQALARLSPGFAGVVVTDVRLPGIDGVELLRRLYDLHEVLRRAAEDFAGILVDVVDHRSAFDEAHCGLMRHLPALPPALLHSDRCA